MRDTAPKYGEGEAIVTGQHRSRSSQFRDKQDLEVTMITRNKQDTAQAIKILGRVPNTRIRIGAPLFARKRMLEATESALGNALENRKGDAASPIQLPGQCI